MKVSVITPTSAERASGHSALYHVFATQTHADTELLVCDDAVRPSPFFIGLCDPRVSYIHRPSRLTVGEKRDLLVRAASGDVIMHFDDDDYYSCDYVETMLSYLGGADFAKLNAWFIYETRTEALFYWDTTAMMPLHYRVEPRAPHAFTNVARSYADCGVWLERQRWGYGFSFVFRREIYGLGVAFDARLTNGEDYQFAAAVDAAGFSRRDVPDVVGLAIHVVHTTNTSKVFPNYRCPPFVLQRVFGEAGRDYLQRLTR